MRLSGANRPPFVVEDDDDDLNLLDAVEVEPDPAPPSFLNSLEVDDDAVDEVIMGGFLAMGAAVDLGSAVRRETVGGDAEYLF